jgi:hypothetical protein
LAKVLMIDPPMGWMYGFPKPAPKGLDVAEIKEWLAKNGYPKKLINDDLHYRFFETELP